jgi:hypothetical protein
VCVCGGGGLESKHHLTLNHGAVRAGTYGSGVQHNCWLEASGRLHVEGGGGGCWLGAHTVCSSAIHSGRIWFSPLPPCPTSARSRLT